MKPVTAFRIIEVKSDPKDVRAPSASAQKFGEAVT
jgi:hypothetical protein